MGVPGLKNNESHYDEELFARASSGPMTAKEIAAIMRLDNAPDAVKRLQYRKHINIEIVGKVPGRTKSSNLYSITRESVG
jgi:hypothetical protein